MDDGDPTTPLMYSCEKCGGQMYPEYYEGTKKGPGGFARFFLYDLNECTKAEQNLSRK